MIWIKRNLLFVVGAVVAGILLIVAGISLVTKFTADAQVREELETQWSSLDGFYQRSVFPSQTNLNNLRNDQQRLMGFIQEARKSFVPVTPVQFSGAQGFKTALDRAVSSLNDQARKAGISAPTNYYYSFTVQAARLSFTPASMSAYAIQLAEIQRFCQILFDSKINRFESIQRARVGEDDWDSTAVAADYVTEPVFTNHLAAVMTYKLNFRCFSTELESVISGFINSPFGFVIRTVEVDSVPLELNPFGLPDGMYPPGGPPPGMMPPTRPGRGGGARGGMRRLPPGGGPTPTPAATPMQPRMFPPPGGMFPPPGGMMPPGMGMSHTNRGGLLTLFQEKPFRVTLVVESVRLR